MKSFVDERLRRFIEDVDVVNHLHTVATGTTGTAEETPGSPT